MKWRYVGFPTITDLDIIAPFLCLFCDQFSLEFSEIDLFIFYLSWVAGALSQHNFLCPTKILHPQSRISPLELSLSG